MLQPYMISSTLFYCSSCVKDTNSVFRCQYCDELFCLSCSREHNYVTCGHSTKRTKQALACIEHDMEFKYYCLKCTVMTCVFCLTNKHVGHEYVSITEAETDVRSRMQTLLDNAKGNANQCYETITCLLEVLSTLQSKHKSAKEELNSTFYSLRKLCDKYYRDAATDLNVIYLQHEHKVKTLLHDMDVYSSTIGNSCKSAKKILMEADSLTLCKLSDVISVQFSELSETSPTELNASSEDVFTNKADEISYQNVLTDFQEKMKLNLDEFTAGLNSQLSDTGDFIPKLTKRNKRSPLPINIKYQVGTFGDSDGELNSPSSFCLGRNDDLIIADKFNHRIQVCVPFVSRGR